jgi:hypothetical protein
MVVLGMVVKETDHEGIPAQRLACSYWARATSARFATTFHEVAFELSTIGVAKMVEVCKSSLRYSTRQLPHSILMVP